MSRIVHRLAFSAASVICLSYAVTTSSFAADGVVTVSSLYSVSETITRLERAVTAKDFMLFATVDHAAGATKAGMTLRPTTLVIFGNPRGGTPLMLAGQTAGLDLPLKMLVWQDESGKVWMSYNDPAWIARRHGVDPALPVVANITSSLAALAVTAGKE